jgi:hypothetical protein
MITKGRTPTWGQNADSNTENVKIGSDDSRIPLLWPLRPGSSDNVRPGHLLLASASHGSGNAAFSWRGREIVSSRDRMLTLEKRLRDRQAWRGEDRRDVNDPSRGRGRENQAGGRHPDLRSAWMAGQQKVTPYPGVLFGPSLPPSTTLIIPDSWTPSHGFVTALFLCHFDGGMASESGETVGSPR